VYDVGLLALQSITNARNSLNTGVLSHFSNDQIKSATDAAIEALKNNQAKLTSGALSTAGTITELVTGALGSSPAGRRPGCGGASYLRPRWTTSANGRRFGRSIGVRGWSPGSRGGSLVASRYPAALLPSRPGASGWALATR